MGKSKKHRRGGTTAGGSKLAAPVNDMDDNEDLKFSSDDDADEKILLDEVLNRKKKNAFQNENEKSIYGIDNSSDDDDLDEELEGDDDEDEQDLKDELADSDIDGMEDDDLPNIKAWGKNKRMYYNTDYVDDDHGGFLQEEDEVAADVEETEALAIQKRLLEEIDNTDDVFEFLMQKPKEDKTEDQAAQQHVISKDLSEMSKKEKLLLLEKESPELLGLINDFQRLMKDVRLHLLPVVQLLDKGKIPACTAGDSIRLRMELILNYCTNISLYLLLKLKRIPVNQHPVIHRLVSTKQLILKLEDIYENQLLPQIELILTTENLEMLIDSVIMEKEEEVVERIETKKKKKKKKKKTTQEIVENNTTLDLETGIDGSQKRAITYQIAKNKGLTPHRKKELKNPRVKHKIKFRKAKIRRKGQIREPRTELDRYGGELSGIKASVRKSIPIK